MTPPEPRLPWLTRTLTGPPGWLLLPAAALTGLLLLYGVSVPGGYFGPTLLGGFAFLVLAIVWLPRFLVGLIRADGRPGLRRHWIRWAAAPAMAAAVAGLVHAGVPWQVRFALSEASMERLARAVSTGAEPGSGGRWAGLLPVSSVTKIGGGVSFQLDGAGFLDTHGLAWIPAGSPPEAPETSYEHLRGPWYEWREGW
ncbi:hypothetical protein HS041_06935 [Planomonospora sp. ID67723]|uniref:hypothetical protein n=1 Tax=Planomonospora sp. ID67723 TaxID=2738134 RepID=UPI0018C3645C|nr:hypothetical protein [Planomonospora sp. ID67723]MBG0827495.1 hypothetical protein [Planomonospora sp. ID67723]